MSFSYASGALPSRFLRSFLGGDHSARAFAEDSYDAGAHELNRLGFGRHIGRRGANAHGLALRAARWLLLQFRKLHVEAFDQ